MAQQVLSAVEGIVGGRVAHFVFRLRRRECRIALQKNCASSCVGLRVVLDRPSEDGWLPEIGC
jgi:hypothetical protein